MQNSWNMETRAKDIETAANNKYDLIIIGGGFTGAGIARECALRGITFCLLDKYDFASGTSSRSSKLIHGGMRYLTSGDFGLVRESTGERNWLRSHLPHLVRPLGFVYPSYQNYKAGPYMVRIGVKLYDIISDWFSGFKNYRQSKIFKKDFVEEFEPAIVTEDPDLGSMILAGFYYDNICDDARVVLETIKESLDYAEGRSVAINYAGVDSCLKNPSGLVKGVKVTDPLNHREFRVEGRCVVSAAGIWTDQVLSAAGYEQQRIYPTKGVHVVVPTDRIGNRNAFTLVSIDDGRFFFVLQRGKVSVIGTTDTAYYPESKNLDQPWCRKEDCDYLLRTVNKMFPRAGLTYDDIIATYAGIRPLIRQERGRSESDLSRRHQVFQTGDGVVAIAGGKSTIYRRMAEDLIFYLSDHKFLDRFADPAYHKRNFSKKPFKIALTRKQFDRIIAEKMLMEGMHPELLEHLYRQYGRGGIEILEKIKEEPQSGSPLLEGYPYCEAEILYILEHECAPRLIDVLSRRTEAQWLIWHHRQPELAEAAAQIISAYYGWSEVKKAAEIKEYLDYIEGTVHFINEADPEERSRPVR